MTTQTNHDTLSMICLTDVVGASVVSSSGHTVGKIEDLVANFAPEGNPRITGMLSTANGTEIFIPIARVATLSQDGAHLAQDLAHKQFQAFARRPGEILLKKDMLGRKLIYIGEHQKPRLVKAIDLDLARIDDSWQLIGIDSAKKSKKFWKVSGDDHAAFLIWSDLEPFGSHVPTSRLRVRFSKLAKIHPSELADLVEAASAEEGEEIIEAVSESRELEADVFEELDDEHQLEFASRRSDKEVANLLASMDADNAADLLTEIDQDRRGSILKLMPYPQQQRVRSLLGYNPETAGGLMSPSVVVLPESATVAEGLARVREGKEPIEATTSVFLTSASGELLASVCVIEMLRAFETAPLQDVARYDPPRLSTSADLPEIATVMADYNLSAVPVVDDAGLLVGQVTVDDLLEILIPENWRRRS